MEIAARVAVEKTAFRFDRAFDYSIPESLRRQARPGCRVLIPFGTSNARRIGMILELVELEEEKSLKPIAAVLDQAPLLSDEDLLLVTWMKQRYFCTLFEAVKLLLPVGMNLHLRIGYQCAQLSDAVPSPEEKLILE